MILYLTIILLLDISECMEPMGLENGLLSDSHITASSYKSENNDPTKVRLNSDSSWIPESLEEPQFVLVRI